MSGIAAVGLLIVVIICAMLTALDASVAFIAGGSIAVIIVCAILAVIKFAWITGDSYGKNNMVKPLGFILVFVSSTLSDIVCAVSVTTSIKWYLNQTIDYGLVSMIGMLSLGWMLVALMWIGFMLFKGIAIKMVGEFQSEGTRPCIIAYVIMSIISIFVSTIIIGHVAPDSFRDAFGGTPLGVIYQFFLSINPLA